ncbi:MAG: acyl transferase [Flammeovirgaceae bacterium]
MLQYKSFPSFNDSNFEDIALRLFKVQATENTVYTSYLHHLGIDAAKITSIDQIPFLPIGFFKTHSIQTGHWRPETVFTSSGTTGATVSRHLVQNMDFYLRHSQLLFEQFFGSLSQFHLLALLPSYLEREGSSLITMIDWFIKRTQSPHAGFYLYNQTDLIKKLNGLKSDRKKTLVWGVSFALLDLAEKNELDLSHCLLMETGGMKGRRQEWVREELHRFLCTRFNVSTIHSEYGMTELLSQAYSKGKGVFQCPSTLKIQIRDLNDPFTVLANGKTGLISVIDLANTHSCAFIQTQDLGRVTQNGSFEVLGRMDNSDVRGCNLLVE